MDLLTLSTLGLVGITAYYAIQTRLLTRNQLRPAFSCGLVGQTQNMDAPYNMALYLKNLGLGPALNINVQYSIAGIKGSKETNMIRTIEPKRELYLPLVHRGQQLTNDRQANRVIEVKLKYEGISGKYGSKFHLNENEFF